MHDPDHETTYEHHREKQVYPGLEQLICAALADPMFADQLVNDPVSALDQAVWGIQLSAIEYELVVSTTAATDIHDFAARLYANVQQRHPRHQ